MLKLPRNIPSAIRTALQEPLSRSTLLEAAPHLARALLELFSADDVLLFLPKDGQENPSDIRLFWETNDQLHEVQQLAVLQHRWTESGLESYLQKDLHARLSAVSYSSFSWPYLQIRFDDAGGGKLSVPREYTLLIPYSSELIVCEATDSAFFGYVVLLFSRFPSLSEAVVESIITLPHLLSEITGAYVNAEQKRKAVVLSRFAHEAGEKLQTQIDCLDTLQHKAQTATKNALAVVYNSAMHLLLQSQALLFSEYNARRKIRITPVFSNLGDIVYQALESLDSFAALHRVNMQSEIEADLPNIKLDLPSISFALKVLLEQSLRSAKPESDLSVRAFVRSSKTLVIEVKFENIQEVQNNAENARLEIKTTDNHDLALLTAMEIIEAHKGILQRAESEGQCSLELPLEEPEKMLLKNPEAA